MCLLACRGREGGVGQILHAKPGGAGSDMPRTFAEIVGRGSCFLLWLRLDKLFNTDGTPIACSKGTVAWLGHWTAKRGECNSAQPLVGDLAKQT